VSKFKFAGLTQRMMQNVHMQRRYCQPTQPRRQKILSTTALTTVLPILYRCNWPRPSRDWGQFSKSASSTL